MKLINGFEGKAFYRIARLCENQQIVNDVNYMRLIESSGKKIYGSRLENVAFSIGYNNNDHFRLVGIGVVKEQRGKGYGKFMLLKTIEYARKEGYSKIRTRTLNGVDFYQKWGGAKIIGMKDNDFLMEMDI